MSWKFRHLSGKRWGYKPLHEKDSSEKWGCSFIKVMVELMML